MSAGVHLGRAGLAIALDTLVTVDRASPVPLYFQVASRLQELIESGELPPGTRLDNEFVLAEQLGLSRPTLRQALRYLMDKGLLDRRRGIGTSVASAKARRPSEITSLYEDLAAAGRAPTTTVLSCDVEPASDEVADALRLAPETPVLAIVRLRHADGEPLAILHNHIRADLGVTADALVDRGLYQVMRAKGTVIASAQQSVGSRRASSSEGRQLHEVRGAPVLTLRRVAFDEADRPVEYGNDVYRASRYTIEMNLVSR